jgi:hypothetical protein
MGQNLLETLESSQDSGRETGFANSGPSNTGAFKNLASAPARQPVLPPLPPARSNSGQASQPRNVNTALRPPQQHQQPPSSQADDTESQGGSVNTQGKKRKRPSSASANPPTAKRGKTPKSSKGKKRKRTADSDDDEGTNEYCVVVNINCCQLFCPG